MFSKSFVQYLSFSDVTSRDTAVFMRFFCLRGLMLLLGLALVVNVALAQSGSSGGTIGNDDKSLSGSREPARSVVPDKPARTGRPVSRERHHTSRMIQESTTPRPQPFAPMGSGVISDGSCICKDKCRQSAQLNSDGMAVCVVTCEKAYSGCNKGKSR
jgi:hypothetical protein